MRGRGESSNLFADLLFTGGCQVSSRSFRVFAVADAWDRRRTLVCDWIISLKRSTPLVTSLTNSLQGFLGKSVPEIRNLLRLSNWKTFGWVWKAFSRLVHGCRLSLAIECRRYYILRLQNKVSSNNDGKLCFQGFLERFEANKISGGKLPWKYFHNFHPGIPTLKKLDKQ